MVGLWIIGNENMGMSEVFLLVLGGGGRGSSGDIRDAPGPVEGRSLASSKFYVQGSKLLGLRLEKSLIGLENLTSLLT